MSRCSIGRMLMLMLMPTPTPTPTSIYMHAALLQHSRQKNPTTQKHCRLHPVPPCAILRQRALAACCLQPWSRHACGDQVLSSASLWASRPLRCSSSGTASDGLWCKEPLACRSTLPPSTLFRAAVQPSSASFVLATHWQSAWPWGARSAVHCRLSWNLGQGRCCFLVPKPLLRRRLTRLGCVGALPSQGIATRRVLHHSNPSSSVICTAVTRARSVHLTLRGTAS